MAKNKDSKKANTRIISKANAGFENYKGNFGDVFHQGVLSIFAMSEKKAIPLGTGFTITNSGILITAKHVVENFINRKEIRKSNEPIENFNLFALYVSDKKHDTSSDFADSFIGGPIPITKITTDTNLDIALCQLQSMIKVGTKETLQFPSVILNFSKPVQGMKILGVGYMESKFSEYSSVKEGEHTLKHINNSRRFITTTGEVVERFESQGQRHWPNFRSTARFEPDMSGGPVFLENGSVGGVICSSISDCAGKSGYISYISELWPALAFKVEVLLEGRTKPSIISLFELVKLNTLGQMIPNIELWKVKILKAITNY